MGHEKFYGTPEGKFVAWQLERSGALYGPETVEARFLRIHYFSRSAYEISFAQWQGQRLLDVFTAAAAPYSDEQRRKSYSKAVLSQLEDITALINPFAEPKEQKKKQEALSEAQKIELLRKMNSSGATGMDGLMKSMSEALKQIKKAD